MERFLSYDQICVEKSPPPPPPPPVKIWNNKPKSEIILSQFLNIKNIKFTSRYKFLWITNAMQLVNFLCVSPKTSKSKMAANYG